MTISLDITEKQLKNRPIKRNIRNSVRAGEIARSIPNLVMYYDFDSHILYFGDDKENSVVVYIVNTPTESLLTSLIYSVRLWRS